MYRYMKFSLFIITLVCTLYAFGCQTTYYAVWEKLGKEKRHLLKDEVKNARKEQEKASEEFKEVLARVKEIYGFDGGELEKIYGKLQEDYETCENRSENVRERIQSVEEIAEDLFREWDTEIKEISNEKFKANSRESLKNTKARYIRLHEAMTKAAKGMNPVLGNLRDYVLYLKHNLNAQAVGALKQEMGEIEIEVESLIRDINESVKEAEDFLRNFK